MNTSRINVVNRLKQQMAERSGEFLGSLSRLRQLSTMCRLCVDYVSITCRLRVCQVLVALFLLLSVGAGQAWGTDAVYTFNTDAGISSLGITKPDVGKGTNLKTSFSQTVGEITMAAPTNGSTATRVWNASGTLDLRVYNGNTIVFSAASGYSIFAITIAGSNLTNLSADVGTYLNGSWSGVASSITLTASGIVNINTITVTYDDGCIAYTFHYQHGVWNTDDICFTPVPGATNNYLTEEMYLPYAEWYNVCWQKVGQSYTVTKGFTGTTDNIPMPFYHYRSKSFGANPQSGNIGGGKGRFHVYHDSQATNKYISFIPTGYTLNFGTGDTWTNDSTLIFYPKTENWDETEWCTSITTLTNDAIGRKIFIGLQTENGYVWCSPYSAKVNLSGLRTKTGSDSWLDGGLSTSYSIKTGKFRIYANSGDDNWYVTFVPHYTLSYANGGGSGSGPSPQYSSIEATGSARDVVLAACSYTKEGYAFDGWNDGTDTYNVDDSYTITEDVTLTAQWSANTIELTLDKNNSDEGSEDGSASVKYDASALLSSPTAPTRTGYTVEGYYADEECTTKVLNSSGTFAGTAVTGYITDSKWTNATSPTTLYTKWTPIPQTVTWYVNGEEYTTGSPSTSVDYDSKVLTLPTAPDDNTLNDCANKFVGWSTKSWGATPKTTASGQYDDLFTDVAGSPKITQDTAFYAVFAEQTEITVTLTNSDFTSTLTGSYTTRNITKSVNKTSRTYELNACKQNSQCQLRDNETISYIFMPSISTYHITNLSTSACNNSSGSTYSGTLHIKSAKVRGNSYTNDYAAVTYSSVSSFDWDIPYGSNVSTCFFVTNAVLRLTDFSITYTKRENYVTQCAANQVRVTYDFDGGTGDDCTEGVTTKSDDYTICSTVPTRAGYTFAGWSDGTKTYTAGTGSYNLQATTTFTAQWTALQDDFYDYMHTNAKTSTESGEYTAPSLSDKSNPGDNTDCRSTHYIFVGWVLADEVETDGTLKSEYTLVTSDQTIYATETNYCAVWASGAGGVETYLAWCDPHISITGDIHLTSVKDVSVYATSDAGNLIDIRSTDLCGVTALEVKYLDADDEDAEVEASSSLFRFCNNGTENYNEADGSAIDVSAANTYDQTYSIKYTPNAYNQRYHYKLQVTMKWGTRTVKTVTHDLYGRALPEEFVIASKYQGQWYALPNTLAGTSEAQSAITPIKITVDNITTPTAATYAPTTTVYKGAARNTATSNVNGIKFTNDESHWLQSGAGSKLWLSATGSSLAQDNVQVWFLKSSDFCVYELAMDPSRNPTTKLGMYGGYMGMYATPTGNSGDIYLLPITNKYTDVVATVTEWGQHSVILAASPGATANYAKAHVEAGEPTEAQIITAINAAMGTAKNIKVPVGDIDLADLSNNEGKLLYVDWYNEANDLLGISCVTIPRIIAASRYMYKDGETTKGPWNTEVHVLPGVTLTANTGSFSPKNATINDLHIYPGATLNVSTDTLTATTLRLRNGWTRAGDTEYNVARVYIAGDAALVKTTATMDYDIYEQSEGRHYYPLAVPFETPVSGIDYADTWLAGYSTYGAGGQYVIKEYDGASRAVSGEGSDNWDIVSSSSNLVPGKGYIMTAIPVYGEAIIRIPLSFDDAWTSDGEKGSATYDEATHTKNVIAVTAHSGSAATSNKRHAGWNLLGVPYMSCFATKDGATHSIDEGFITGKMVLTGNPSDPFGGYDDGVVYVTVPTHDFSEYIQSDITDGDTKLLPGWCFFIQAAKDGNLTFAAASQQPNSDLSIYAPQRTADTSPVLRTGVILYSDDGEKSDKFGLVISDRYTAADYEVGADLEKMFGSGYTLATYSLSGSTRLAFNALARAEAAQLIPVGFRAPETGSYTFALNPRYPTDGLLRVELIDYQTQVVTDLLTSSYTFTTGRTQDDTRFALNLTYTDDQTETPTGTAPPLEVQPDIFTRKFILNGCIYIQRGNRIYDLTGKEVRL